MPLPPPRRRFGQNFLVDAAAVRWIVERCGAGAAVEIGPGRGALTEPLAARGAPLVAVELDRDLAAHLRSRFVDRPTVRVVEADAVRIDWRSEVPGWLGADARPVVVGNLPYNVATPIVRRLLGSIDLFPRLVLMFQAEVADRLVATEGADYGYLSVEAHLSAVAVERRDLPPGSFHPAPKVSSSVLVLEPRPDRPSAPLRRAALALASAAFAHRRKVALSNLRSNLSAEEVERAAAVLLAAGLSRTARAEEFPPDLWVRLAGGTELADGAGDRRTAGGTGGGE